jgi:hypothetical protein
MEIIYVNKYGEETVSGHSVDNTYIHECNKIKKCELEIEEDDYIEYISCAYSSQKTFIRSIRIATKNKKLLVHEGEIELKNKEPEELMSDNRGTSDTSKNTRKSKYLSRSAVCTNDGNNQDQQIAMVYKSNLKSEIRESLSENEEEKETVSEEEEEFGTESSFTLKRPSLVDFYLKTQSWNLGKLNLKVLGFKSYFNGYMEDIEVYAEPINKNENDLSSKDDHSDINN